MKKKKSAFHNHSTEELFSKLNDDQSPYQKLINLAYIAFVTNR